MAARPRVLVVNPLGWGPCAAAVDPVAAAFVAELGPVELRVDAHPEPDALAAGARAGLAWRPDLVYACGCSALRAVLAACGEAGSAVPVLYHGAHPEHEGVPLNPPPAEPHVGGVWLRVPLLEDGRQFRVLGELFPRLEGVYGVFAGAGAFAANDTTRPTNDQMYADGWRESAAGGRFPALGKLADLIDARFYEFGYRHAGPLREALAQVPGPAGPGVEGVRAVVLSCVDCRHVPGAEAAVAAVCHARGVPFVALSWLDFHGPAGPVLGFENDWLPAAAHLGRVAAGVLAGGPVPAIVRRDRFRVRHYARHAAARGLDFPPAALARAARAVGPLLIDDQTFGPAHPDERPVR